jgi:hypothetical protein
MAILPAAPKAPPRKAAPVKPQAPRSLTAVRREGLESLGGVGILILSTAKQYADAGAVSLHWPNIADEGAKLAETNDAVARGIDALCNFGPMAGLIGAALPFALQLAANHGRIDPGAAKSLGVIEPDDLARDFIDEIKRKAAVTGDVVRAAA